jgi:hypothetical protein
VNAKEPDPALDDERWQPLNHDPDWDKPKPTVCDDFMRIIGLVSGIAFVVGLILYAVSYHA